MSLRDLNLDQRDGRFDSDRENLLESFYIPCLSQATSYKRMAGYFCSNSLYLAVRGLDKFVLNGGKIQLIANVVLSESDQEDIQKFIQNKEQEVFEEIESLNDALSKKHISILGYLLKKGLLEIKIATIVGGIAHNKWGIFSDEYGNHVTFNGSDNETVKGWIGNHERFEVHVSWNDSDWERFVKPTIDDWRNFWNDDGERVKIYSISEAFKKKLIRTAPSNSAEFEKLTIDATRELLSNLRKDYGICEPVGYSDIHSLLRPYQKDAVDSWLKNGKKGVLKMATGTGKTFTALACIRKALNERKLKSVVIVAPTQLLVRQWVTELKKQGFYNIVSAMQNKKKWTESLKSALHKIKLKRSSEIIIVATYASFSKPDLNNILLEENQNYLLVCDEMHHSWAPQSRKALSNEYTYRLGLSATPELYLDDLGTEDMLKYFGGIVFNYDMESAIPEYLTEYEYHAELIHLTPDELSDYEDISKRIASKIARNEGKIPDDAFLLILKRSKIVVNAEAKWAAFEKILEEIPNIKRTLIYCSDQQIKRVKSILRSRKIRAHQITHEESLAYREEIIEYFKKDRYDAIVAMKVLDEGVDVPGIENAIILASSGNPVEYVQRRGRILRKAPGKDFSTIYDILALPWKTIPSNISQSEVSAIMKELKRVDEFTNTSRNPLEVKRKIAPYMSALARRDF